jgi:demethylmenaquinone methyltransferase / 2-methoxy-6-polyprenyl-1,4-benzoquinol methylase
MNASDITDFGYQLVTNEKKYELVQNVFSSVSSRYNLMNDLMSFGAHRYWKEKFIRDICFPDKGVVLDVAAGTCDLTRLIIDRVNVLKNNSSVIALDFNASMLLEGKMLLQDMKSSYHAIEYLVADGMSIPLSDHAVDVITIGFGMRNIVDKKIALQEFYRVLKPKAKLYIMEFSEVTGSLKSFYDYYSFNIIPKLGKLFSSDEESYKYLVESIRKHPKPEVFKEICLSAGFEKCSYYSIYQGIVTVHVVEKD